MQNATLNSQSLVRCGRHRPLLLPSCRGLAASRPPLLAVGATPAPASTARPLTAAATNRACCSSSLANTPRRRRRPHCCAAFGSDPTAAADSTDAANRADAAAVEAFLQSCPPRIEAALRAIAADPRGALRQYARDREVMAALGTVLSRGMAPGRRAAIERLVAATAEEAEEAAVGGGSSSNASSSSSAAAAETEAPPPGSDVPAPGQVVSAMYSDPELAKLMADPEVKAALAAARAALLSGGGDAAARRALAGRGSKVDRAMELLEARLGRFVGAPGGTVDV